MNYAANFQHLTPCSFLERAIVSAPNEIAVINNDKATTYKELHSDCMVFAEKLNYIARPNDKVGYLCGNIYEFLLGFLSVPLFGGIIVPINSRFNESLILKILSDAQIKVLIIEKKYFKEKYASIIDRILIINSSGASNSYEKFIEHSPQKKITHFIHEQDDFSINYTSGTTGISKGVVYSHRSMYLNVLGECIHNKLSNNTNYLWVLPIFHCNGWGFPWAIIATLGTQFFVKDLVLKKFLIILTVLK